MKYLHQIDTDFMLSLQASNVMCSSKSWKKEMRFNISFLKATAVFL